jgi:hypothetical protein
VAGPPRLFSPGRARAAPAAVRLWGLPYEAWSLILFMLLSVMALRMVMRRGAG